MERGLSTFVGAGGWIAARSTRLGPPTPAVVLSARSAGFARAGGPRARPYECGAVRSRYSAIVVRGPARSASQEDRPRAGRCELYSARSTARVMPSELVTLTRAPAGRSGPATGQTESPIR